MNVLTAVRANATGLLSPTPAERRAALEQVRSVMRANLLGRSAKAETVAKAQTQGKASTAAVGGGLGREAFLELLLAQIRNQDPLEPAGNAEMVAQLAQIAALEQMTYLNESFEALSSSIDQLNFISASSLLGRQVVGITVDGDLHEGIVERIEMQGSLVVLTVDGQRMYLAGVTRVE